MNSAQYEELCRRFISDQFDLPMSEVKSTRIPNPQRPGMKEFVHQIDHYWETQTHVAKYVHIANAKWRSSRKVEQGDVMKLEAVRQKVGAHKGFIFTNVGFTDGAHAAAEDAGIALHIVKPSFDYARLPQTNRDAMQRELDQLAKQDRPICSHHVELRGLDLGAERKVVPSPGTAPAPSTRQATGYSTRAQTSYSTKTVGPSQHGTRGGVETRGGQPGSSSNKGSRGPPGRQK